jgi:hypothetical protein
MIRAAAGLLLLAGCGSTPAPPQGTPDAAPDAGFDAGHLEAAHEASLLDAPRDAPRDAGVDGDAGPEASACTACLAFHCSSEITLCVEDSECLALVACAGDMPLAGCACSHKAGAALYVSIAQCKLEEACNPDCQTRCGVDAGGPAICAPPEGGLAQRCDGGLPDAGGSFQNCNACLHVSCATEAALCGEGSDCIDYESCVLSCRAEDPSCAGACRARYPDGYAQVHVLFECETQFCERSCVP